MDQILESHVAKIAVIRDQPSTATERYRFGTTPVPLPIAPFVHNVRVAFDQELDVAPLTNHGGNVDLLFQLHQVLSWFCIRVGCNGRNQ